MSVQSWLAAVLNDALPDTFDVRPYPFAPDEGEKDRAYVAVYRPQTVPGPTGRHAFQHTLSVELMTGHSDPKVADEKLDDLLMVVLPVLEQDEDLAGLTWTEINRQVVIDKYPSLAISCTCYEPRPRSEP